MSWGAYFFHRDRGEIVHETEHFPAYFLQRSGYEKKTGYYENIGLFDTPQAALDHARELILKWGPDAEIKSGWDYICLEWWMIGQYARRRPKSFTIKQVSRLSKLSDFK